MDTNAKIYIISTMAIISIVIVVLAFLYTQPNLPNLSIEEFSVPALNKTSDQISGDIYLDLKLRNMNKAAGIYYDDPFTLAFSYYPIEEPYQKYVWEYTLPPFYQGNGKTKHIRTFIGKHLREPSMVVVVDHDELEKEEVYKPVRSLLMPSSMDGENDGTEELNSPATSEVVVRSFRVNVMVNYRFKLWIDHYRHVLEVGVDVVVDVNTGERVSKGSVQLVAAGAAAGGGGRPLLVVVVLFTSFLLVSV